MSDSDELWVCPECGHSFVTRNMWHSCSNYSLEHHFAGASPEVRRVFDRFVELIERHGPVEIISQKTRIAIQAKVRFASCVVRKRWLLANLWLMHRARHPRLQRVETFGPNSYANQFRFDSPEEMDASFEALVSEAYAVGLREHLKR